MVARLFVLVVLAALPAFSQGHYEIASIRPSRSGAGPQDGRSSIRGDRFDAVAYTVGDILDMLNGWQLDRVTGGPAWMRIDRYDIHAKADAEIPPEDRESAIMALLKERFQLAAHRETREITSMVLRAPKRPAGLKPATEGETYSIRFGERNDPTFTAVPMSAVTNYLAQMWHAPVVDQTGLEGIFDFSLEPSVVDPQPGQTWSDRVREAVLAFGFKVEMKKVSVEITVVDRCERPTGN
jgi:uncharacterized protein (TIGR03435 family)